MRTPKSAFEMQHKYDSLAAICDREVTPPDYAKRGIGRLAGTTTATSSFSPPTLHDVMVQTASHHPSVTGTHTIDEAMTFAVPCIAVVGVGRDVPAPIAG